MGVKKKMVRRSETALRVGEDFGGHAGRMAP